MPRGERQGARIGEDRSGVQREGARGRRHQGRHRHGQEAARLPFEQQQLDSQQHSSQRRREDGRHAGGGAGHQQGLAFGVVQVDGLRQQGANGAARHDDGPFGAERPAGWPP
ncbi:hypothetical protein G6F65_022719 [Rhizopus arrhizus]|nr:hypothetical protein G6F65_022719 [Rhizopus arrhizus]